MTKLYHLQTKAMISNLLHTTASIPSHGRSNMSHCDRRYTSATHPEIGNG